MGSWGNFVPEDGIRALLNGGTTVIAAGIALIVLYGAVFLLGQLATPFRWLRLSLAAFAKGACYVTGTRYRPKIRWTVFFLWTTVCSVSAAFGPPYVVT